MTRTKLTAVTALVALAPIRIVATIVPQSDLVIITSASAAATSG